VGRLQRLTSVRRRGRGGDAGDPRDAGHRQGGARRHEGGTGGDHVVEQQHPQPAAARPSAELRGGTQPLGASVPGLRLAVAAVQEAATRHPQLVRHGPGQQLGLVVTAAPGAGAAGGGPCDEVELVRAEAQAVHHQVCEVAGDPPPIAELQTVHDLARHPLERERGTDLAVGDLHRRGGERETAPLADGDPGLVAAGARRVEHHAPSCTQGV